MHSVIYCDDKVKERRKSVIYYDDKVRDRRKSVSGSIQKVRFGESKNSPGRTFGPNDKKKKSLSSIG